MHNETVCHSSLYFSGMSFPLKKACAYLRHYFAMILKRSIIVGNYNEFLLL